jgi:hypothetical protein
MRIVGQLSFDKLSYARESRFICFGDVSRNKRCRQGGIPVFPIHGNFCDPDGIDTTPALFGQSSRKFPDQYMPASPKASRSSGDILIIIQAVNVPVQIRINMASRVSSHGSVLEIFLT